MTSGMKTRLFLASISIGLCFAGSLLVPSAALARTETLRWTAAAAQDVVRFEVSIGTTSRVYTETRNLGLPTPDANGVYSSSFVVPDENDVYIALRAIASSGMASHYSNEQLRLSLISGGTLEPPATDPRDPNPDALQRVDFSQGGANDWLDTQRDNSLLEDDSLFNVVDLNGSMALTTQSADTDIHSHYVADPSQFSNTVLSGRMAVDRVDAGIGVTAYSHFPNADVYYSLKREGGNSFAISGHGNLNLACSTPGTGVTPQPGVWYEFELIVVDEGGQNRISASVWAMGSQKPSMPQAECVDASSGRPTGGKFGVWSTGLGQKYWDLFEVLASGGSSGLPTAPPEPPVLIQVIPNVP
jgi:hypothetical protein